MVEKRGGYWDDFRLPFNQPYQPYRPAHLIDVLCELDVVSDPVSVQVEAVRGWLRENEPSDALRRSLMRKGDPWPEVVAQFDHR